MGRTLALLSLLVSLGCVTSADREAVHRRGEEYDRVRKNLDRPLVNENKDKNDQPVHYPAPLNHWQNLDRP